jgi:hypothetical protein
MSAPLIYRSLDDLPTESPHRDYVCMYPTAQRVWSCVFCRTAQARTTARYWRHFAQCCTGRPDSLCMDGPYCPHCAELPMLGDNLELFSPAGVVTPQGVRQWR